MSSATGQSARSEGSDRLDVCVLHSPPDDALAHLQALLDPAITLCTGSHSLDSNTQVLVHGRPSLEQLRVCTGLEALVIPYAGVPAETRALLLESFPDLSVYNLHHNAAAAAELAMGLLLAAAKTLIPVDRRFRNDDWRSRYDGAPTTLLDGKKALILGYGAIGQRLARLCSAFGMTVHAVCKRSRDAADSTVTLHTVDELAALLPIADVLLIALPMTPATEGLIGSTELSLLPPSCVLVNIARGAIVDEDSLFTALKSARIAAAGIDVWYSYPQSESARSNTSPSQFPFRELDNVVMSPHRGGAFRLQELEQRRMDDLAQTLNALAQGTTVPHPVDVQAGY